VIHLAALTSVRESVSNPVENAYINVLGSLNLLEMCRRYQIKKFVFSSSAAVYGPGASIPVKEEADLKPLSPYGISKLTLEYYLSYYLNQYQITNVVLRYANVYGPRQRLGGESGVIAIFVNN
jgi:UDP-glucose 4-epimerase